MENLLELLSGFDINITKDRTIYNVLVKNISELKDIKTVLKTNKYGIVLVDEIYSEDEDGNELHYAIIKVAA